MNAVESYKKLNIYMHILNAKNMKTYGVINPPPYLLTDDHMLEIYSKRQLQEMIILPLKKTSYNC